MREPFDRFLQSWSGFSSVYLSHIPDCWWKLIACYHSIHLYLTAALLEKNKFVIWLNSLSLIFAALIPGAMIMSYGKKNEETDGKLYYIILHATSLCKIRKSLQIGMFHQRNTDRYLAS